MGFPKAPATQKLLNIYPEWAAIRQSEQSVGAQLLNVPGNHLQDLHEQIDTLGKNYFLSLANLDEIDVTYKFSLPRTFEFELANGDEQNPIYEVPTVSGMANDVWYPVFIASGDNIESFWYLSYPNRTELVLYPITNSGVLDNSGVTLPGCLFSGVVGDSPFEMTASGMAIDWPPTKLWVETTGGTKYLWIDEEKRPRRGEVTLTGLDASGNELTETLFCLYDDVTPTASEWSRLDKVETFNIYPATTGMRIFTHRFGYDQDPAILPKIDWFNQQVSSFSKEAIDTFWSVSYDDDVPMLHAKIPVSDDLRDRVAGSTDLQSIRSWTLLDPSGEEIGEPIDIAIQPFSNNLYVLDENNKLFIYDTEFTLPDMSLMTRGQSNTISIIEPSTFHLGSFTEDLQLQFVIRKPIEDVLKHRVFTVAPNGTKYLLKDGALITWDSDNWDLGTLSERSLRHSAVINLDQYGDWVWTLEARYPDSVIEYHECIVSVDTKTAAKELDLESELTPKGLDFDSAQRLWYLGYNPSTLRYSKYLVILHKDVMLIDYNNGVMFFKEQYEEIKVE